MEWNDVYTSSEYWPLLDKVIFINIYVYCGTQCYVNDLSILKVFFTF